MALFSLAFFSFIAGCGLFEGSNRGVAFFLADIQQTGFSGNVRAFGRSRRVGRQHFGNGCLNFGLAFCLVFLFACFWTGGSLGGIISARF